MDNTVLVAFIGASIPALASILVTIAQTNKTMVLLEERDKNMKEQLDKLTTKVEAHNDFGLQLARLETRVNILEDK